MKNFNILGFTEKSDFNEGCSRKTNIEKGDCLKRGLDSLLIWGEGGGDWQERRGSVFEGGGVDTQCTLWIFLFCSVQFQIEVLLFYLG